jgi:hypothetical protein
MVRSYEILSGDSYPVLIVQTHFVRHFSLNRWVSSRRSVGANCRRPIAGDHQTFMPPSTTISTPVTYELSSEARNRATFATSSGRPRRPNSVLPSM